MLLTLCIVVPALAAAAVACIPSSNRAALRTTALAGSLVTLVLSLVVLARFRVGEAGFQLVEQAPWIPQWGISYRLGIDGISLWMVLLTTLFLPLVVLASWEEPADRPKGFFVCLLALEAALIGVFLALDLILFDVFFEAMLVPMYALIGIWGGAARRYAAVKFFLYTLVGGLLMLVAILTLYAASGSTSFDYDALQRVELARSTQIWLFLAFFAAFAIKVPLFPLHTWLPDAHTEAPTAGSVLLAAVLLKIGAYGFLRFSLPFFPDATRALAPLVLGLAVVGILYGALVAMVQRDVKRLVAYSSVAHLGFVVLGIFALDTTAAAAGVLQMVNHGLSTGALFLLIGFLYARTHSRLIAEHSGVAKAAPLLAGLFLVTTMSSIALPGLNGFVGEFPILLGAYQTVRWAAIASTFGVILAAIYLLWAYQRVFHGPVEGLAVGLVDLNRREVAVVAPLVVLMLAIGLYPKPFYDRITPSVQAVIEGVAPDDGVAAAGDAEESTS